MKFNVYCTAIAKLLATIMGTIFAVILLYYIGRPWEAEKVPVNAPAIAEWQQTEAVRQLLTPSVFTTHVTLFVSEKDSATQKEKEALCVQGIGTAFTVSDKGYFVTNNHAVDPTPKQTACLEKLTKERNVPASSLTGIRFRFEYTLTDNNKITFPVEIVKTFPEIDMAVLKPLQNEMGILPRLPKKWTPVTFRTGSPSVIDGKVFSVKNSKTMPLIIPDERIAMMGSVLNLPYTITDGKLGNNMFYDFGKIPFIHFIAPINSGNSGGPLLSLLDFKVIGMASMSKADRNVPTSQAGAIPFWEIQKALKTVDMK